MGGGGGWWRVVEGGGGRVGKAGGKKRSTREENVKEKRKECGTAVRKSTITHLLARAPPKGRIYNPVSSDRTTC